MKHVQSLEKLASSRIKIGDKVQFRHQHLYFVKGSEHGYEVLSYDTMIGCLYVEGTRLVFMTKQDIIANAINVAKSNGGNGVTTRKQINYLKRMCQYNVL